MPHTYRIIITNESLQNLQEAAQYIFEDSPQNAAVVSETILNAIDSLASMPDRFRRVGKSRKRSTAIHAMVVRPFIVYYSVDDKRAAVHILHVIHGARKQPRRFKSPTT